VVAAEQAAAGMGTGLEVHSACVVPPKWLFEVGVHIGFHQGMTR